MGPLIVDRVKETTTTTGTGTLSLGGAASGFRTFVAGVGDGNSCCYAIVGGTEWEVGYGTVTDAATDTLSRDHVEASSNAGALVNFGAGTKDVFVTIPAAAVNWLPLVHRPINADFAWVNQGSATIAETKGGLYLEAPSNGGAQGVQVRKKAAPATPYTATAAFLLNWDIAAAGFGGGGVCFRQSSDGKLHVFMLSTQSGVYEVMSRKFTDATTLSANYSNPASLAPAGPVVWMRLGDDGTNRLLSMSADGVNFIQFQSVGRTDFLTADEIGFCTSPYSAKSGLTLISWREE